MSETMVKKDGIGLAAPQIGINQRIIVIMTASGPEFFINPLILKKSLQKDSEEEGCLSVPKTFGEVKRSKKISVEYFDENGAQKKILAEGLMARVILHETDHLDGLLFIDKAKNIRREN